MSERVFEAGGGSRPRACNFGRFFVAAREYGIDALSACGFMR